MSTEAENNKKSGAASNPSGSNSDRGSDSATVSSNSSSKASKADQEARAPVAGPVVVEDEQETITLNVDHGKAAADEFVDEEDSEPQQEEEERHRERALRRPTTAREVLTQYVPNRSERADEKLRAHLVGKIGVRIEGSSERFMFELITGRAQVTEQPAEIVSDTTISISEQNLLRVVNGELNPQIAMLSGKINVTGKAEQAIYFFNLVAPR
jgi:putative sterol carrier protein